MDIVVTIPKSEYANDEAETRDYLANPENMEQFWTLSKRPKKLNIGDRVFFVKHGRIESSMRVTRIKDDATTVCETTGRVWSGKCQIFMDDLRMEHLDIRVRGFQGFRYRWW
ncbi:hypothetical protein [Parageobacillus thermoglucosidasius]|jgi:hypothetical protein|uniref:hypothetical protein n=1 Tax=Parageobacillus thermoglucosidasius TaxID=1426 RepID=UPI000E155E59|nr:hypothetical protein [Parageobacillus thermoglucosidasius]MED4904111.1 hypothetical protein [Parageobacillus thermoglucosidasius]MED4915661.1 hypothetical protein [Parageobacillus thermoglucosidasius]MED4945074.1 hypothetical protein [Parageobacillus thermoglucosidasius]MED4983729.1 hypothetical protein [Parageobacillus thermoglucosidasius]RDE19328.1 hypothetical protein DV714_20050 [Parageobacillus thermoglucosidasius]